MQFSLHAPQKEKVFIKSEFHRLQEVEDRVRLLSVVAPEARGDEFEFSQCSHACR
jgi:hypothetical protein